MRITTLLTAAVGLSAAALLMGCAARAGDGAPADLQITYEWREGSLPPPYHYEYGVSLGADGAGEVTMIPDYPADDVPVWTEPFTVERAALDELYRLMVEQGLLSQRWRALDLPPVGGSSANLTVRAEGREVAIPAFLPDDQQARADAIYAALLGVVPQALLDDLEARRAAYEAEHTP